MDETDEGEGNIVGAGATLSTMILTEENETEGFGMKQKKKKAFKNVKKNRGF